MKRIILLFMFVSAFFFGGCAQIKINVTDKQINEKLSENFPLKKTFLVFELACNNPQIILTEGTEKVTISVDAKVGVNMMNNIMPIGDGTIQATSGLKFNTDTGELFLNDCQVDKLDIKNIPAQYTEQITELTKFTNTTLTGLLSQHPIYVLESKDRDVDTIIGKFKLQDMQIQNGKLVLTMGK
ncbi:DUF1439 domain-containing protein [Desulforegula conservatrix]|uniref:DUF1439 domain-containing protein n=1 Tax=Desulforegula conservatrix TaxID=153026 RepID=UPI000400ED6D|nr:DUF1439 domain-containing protein [Desulforegula conservatrix]